MIADAVTIIGGSDIFAMFHGDADRLELTEVLAEIPGDTFMPDPRSQGSWRGQSGGSQGNWGSGQSGGSQANWRGGQSGESQGGWGGGQATSNQGRWGVGQTSGSQGDWGRQAGSSFGGQSGGNWGSQSGGSQGSWGQSGGSGQWGQGSGLHRGKGPKGYQRTDERIKELICERLRDDPEIDPSEVSISVQGGKVTLEGTVDSRQAKNSIEDIAEQFGVQEVQNNLRVQKASQTSGSQAGEGARTASTTGKAGTEESDKTNKQNKH